MTSKDKLIGVALIVIGLAFIALGVIAGMPKQTTNNNNDVYSESQLNGENEEEIENEESEINVYEEETSENEEDIENDTENNQEEESNAEEGGTRYIY